MKLRFMGAEPAYVPALGRTVQPDEQVDIPDELIWSEKNPDGLVWPDALWSEAGAAKPKAAPSPAVTKEG